MTDVLIIGAGPAGLAAAIYVQRAGKKALLLEEYSYGGQIINTPEIENYPGIAKISGFDFATNLYQQAINLGAELVFEKAVEIEDKNDKKIVKGSQGNLYEAKAVIIATGAKNRHLGINKEEELIGRGISYCATCDGDFFKGKDVAVNGGGNTALSDALFLSDYCNKVYLIHRRDEFRGEAGNLEALRKKDNVEFILNSSVSSLLGEEKLEGLELTHKLTGEKRQIKVSGLFVAIGQEPANEDFKNVTDLDKAGYIFAGEDMRTKTAGIFTAGDCRTKEVRQLTTAASDGAVAALMACEYCNKNA